MVNSYLKKIALVRHDHFGSKASPPEASQAMAAKTKVELDSVARLLYSLWVTNGCGSVTRVETRQ